MDERNNEKKEIVKQTENQIGKKRKGKQWKKNENKKEEWENKK